MSISLRTALGVFTLGAATLATVGCERRVEERRDDTAARPLDATDRTATDVTRPTDPVERVEGLDRDQNDTMGTVDRDKTGDGPVDKKTAANDPSIQRLATARCDREQTCNNIGVDKKWATRDACMSDLSEDLVDELNMDECPGGIVQKELDECLAEIKNESCNNPIDKIERFAACRESDLCKAMIN
jgi:hypothetical protein